MKSDKCLKKTDSIILTLWNGKNGYRRYPLCVSCVKAVQAEKKEVEANGRHYAKSNDGGLYPRD